MSMVSLGDLMAKRVPSLNPAQFKDEEFELWSIPAFDAGAPERLSGSEIGSSKKVLQPGDVLLSRIVPHIRRSWVVSPTTKGERQIGSGEWIVFRSERVDPNYLRHFLISDVFHPQFMQTVAGVGGSLLRARPEGVKEISLFLPPLNEQKRIAAILDQADELRRKRQLAIERLNQLGQAIFHDMFVKGKKNWPEKPLADVVSPGTIVTYGIVQAGEEFPGGIPYIRTGDIKNGEVVIGGLRHTDPSIAAKFERSRVRAGEIVMSIRATVGTVAFVPDELDGANLTQGTARISPGPQVKPWYLIEYIRSPSVQSWIEQQVKGATFREITLTRLRELMVILPPESLQTQFSEAMDAIFVQRKLAANALNESDTLFAALQHRAFQGEL